MKAIYPFQKSPRCKAKSKRTRKSCMAPAVKGWTVCRFHGARGGAPKGERNGRYRHGLHCQSAITERETLRDLMNQCVATLARTEHRQAFKNLTPKKTVPNGQQTDLNKCQTADS